MNAEPTTVAPAAAASGPPPAWYTIAWLLGLPLVVAYLLWRSVRQGEYRRHWGERFLGHGAAAPLDAGVPRIWIHAVSVGETRAAQPLVEQLARAHPDAQFTLTHMTPTGRAAGADLVRAFPGRVVQRYLPYDLPFAVARFLRETRPDAGVLMETEIWPQLLGAARARAIPVVLANARLSQRSLAKALRQPTLMRRAAAAIAIVGAQTEADRGRIARIYDGPVIVTGNGKFDITPDAALIARGRQLRGRLQAALGERPIWLFASTRDGEEQLILDALAAAARSGAASMASSAAATADCAKPAPAPDEAGRPLLLFVPRHPQRFDAVAALLRGTGARVIRRAQWDSPLQDAAPDAVLLGDSMGEMPLYYAMADAALIGGSLLPLGGQNLIEACACACPVVLGPHMFNFSAAAADALAAGAARSVGDAAEAVQCLQSISADPAVREAMAAAGVAFAAAHRGASARTVALIEGVLSSGSSAGTT